MSKKRPVSPEASGGAGTLFEYRVGAIMLSHLLAGTHPPGLSMPVVGVAWQQLVTGHLLDDIVVYGEDAPNGLCTEYQVKRTLKVTTSDKEFIDVLAQVLHTLSERRDAVACGELALGLIADGEAAPLDQLKTLVQYAHAHSSYESFDKVFVVGVVNEKVRNRLIQVRQAVEQAIRNGAPDLGGIYHTTHAALAALHVWRVSDADHQEALNRIRPVAEAFDKTPVDLFSHLTALAEEWGPLAGVVDAASVWRQLRRRGLRQRPVEGQPPAEPVDADAVVRGPMASLALEAAFDEANRLLAEGDPSAAPRFHEIADKLEEKGFAPHATLVRRHEADALQKNGDADAAVRTRVALAWSLLDVVQPWEAGFALNDANPVSEASTRVLAATQAAVHLAKGGDIKQLAVAFDALADDDPYRDRTAAFLSEEAIAMAEPEIVLVRQQALEGIARSTSQAAMRVQMCLGDATGQWLPRLRDIHRRFDRPLVAWAHARYARHLALTGDGAGAQEQYLLAIERACVAEMFDEAADWLYAWRTVRFWYHDFDEDEQHPLAQALRPNARPSRLPGSAHTTEQALRAMQKEDHPAEALRRVRLWQWQATVRADLSGEVEAAQTLGALLRRHEHADAAIPWFVRAGAAKLAASAAKELTKAPTELDVSVMPTVDICKVAVFAAVAAAADLLDDESARAWAAQALMEISKEPINDQAEDVRIRAFEVLAALCPTLTDPQIHELLRVVEPLIERSPGQYRLTDESVAKILVTLTERSPDAVPLMARALTAHERMAGVVLDRPELLAANRDVVTEWLVLAAAHNQFACLGLIMSGADPASAIPLARERVARDLLPQEHQQGRVVYRAGADAAAILASVLEPEIRVEFARAMLKRALDRRETTTSRRDALNGLINIADKIDEDSRKAILPQILELARGEWDGGPTDEIEALWRGPFNGVTINTGSNTLTDLALLGAARLASELADQLMIERIGMALLRGADRPAQWRIGYAFTLLSATGSNLDLEHCAIHPVPALRAVAAVRWARDPGCLPSERVEALAKDDNYLVRRNFALAVRDNYETLPADLRDRVIELQSLDSHRSIRQLVPGLN
ncbi:hypothetical protein [Streptosporangium sp. NPDC006007]|uniref:hypothetical protein n=1 Tax=Streptosporangium sp. NPDC006007 TaxID=3154575 RepID=UPI0033A841CE